MLRSSSQVTIRVTKENQTLHTLALEPGVILAGRSPACDLHLDDPKVSRRHCEIRQEAEQTAVVDLGGRNGTFLGNNRLPSEQSVDWRPGVPLQIGPFMLHLVSSTPVRSMPQVPGRTRRIACGHARPSVITLKDKPITIGRDKQCNMVLDDSRVSHCHCQVEQRGDQVWVSDLSGRGFTRVGSQRLTANVPHVWPEGELLHLGAFSLVQSVEAAAPAQPQVQTSEPDQSPAGGIGTRMWQEWVKQLPWVPIVLMIGAVCLALGIGAGALQVLNVLEPTAIPAVALSPTPISQASATPPPAATQPPAEAPTSTPAPTLPSGTLVSLATSAPPPTLVCVPQTAGWLELPFPYDGRNENFGTEEQFRAASQRTAAGGRITSFFDHEFPLYKLESEQITGAPVNDTLVLFDGSQSLNKWTHPDEEGDYYSGHPAIDFSTFEWGKSTTPILAPAYGTFLAAGTDEYGNNFVWLQHERDEEGLFRTSYLHLEYDEHFGRLREMQEGDPIQAGERIGTMGNTGNSSGHHLHFEVRRDCNGDGLFSLVEAVDPYGFMPSLEISIDPMAEFPCGGSQYLWKYPWEPGDDGGCAQPERRRQLDPTPFQGFVSIATFIFTTADPSKPTRVPIWLSDADLEKVDIQSIKVHRYDLATNNWEVIPESTTRFKDGQHYVQVHLNIAGKYTVTGKPLADIIPPTTSIRLAGPQQNGVFTGPVTVELIGRDEGEGVREIRYSVDCGQTWTVYGDQPFTLTSADLSACGYAEAPADSEGDEWGLDKNDYLILAAAEDWAGNWQQPPSLQQFKLAAAGDNN